MLHEFWRFVKVGNVTCDDNEEEDKAGDMREFHLMFERMKMRSKQNLSRCILYAVWVCYNFTWCPLSFEQLYIFSFA
jgi:hypothetical protein